MGGCHENAGNGDCRALEEHERDLVVRERAVEALRQLSDTEDAPDENQDGRERDACCAERRVRDLPINQKWRLLGMLTC